MKSYPTNFSRLVLGILGFLLLPITAHAEKNLYLGVNGGASLFSSGLYSDREIKYKFESLDSTNKTPSLLYTLPVVGLSTSLVLSEAWIIGYSGSVMRATGLSNPTQSKLELKKCGTPTPVACETLDPHYSPTFTYSANLTRTDQDLSLTRRLGNTNWLVFGALRYQYYSVKGERPAQDNNDTSTTKIIPTSAVVTGAIGQTSVANTNFSSESLGGAIGIGYTLNVFENWYLNMQAGLLVLRGVADYKYSRADGKYSFTENNSLLGLGTSGAVSLGYTVSGTHILLLSYKFQVFRMSALSGSRVTVDQYGTPLASSDNLFSDGAVDVVNTVTLSYIYKVF